MAIPTRSQLSKKYEKAREHLMRMGYRPASEDRLPRYLRAAAEELIAQGHMKKPRKARKGRGSY